MKNLTTKILLITVLLYNIKYSGVSQSINNSELKISQIMEGEDFVGHLPKNVYWSYDSKTVYFQWNPENEVSDSLYQYQVADGNIKKVDFETEWNLPSEDLTYSKDKTKAIYSKHGDIFMLNLVNGEIFQITNTNDWESAPHFTNSENKIAYLSNNNLFCWEIATGKLEQITDFTKKNDEKSGNSLNDKDKWLENDQLSLFKVVKQREDKKETAKKYNELKKIKRPLSIPLKGMNVMKARISPDGNYVSYILYKHNRSKQTNVPNYVTKSGYTENITARPKVGSQSNRFQMFIYDINHRKTYEVDFSGLEGINDLPKYTKDYPDKEYKNEGRIGHISGPFWNKEGSNAFIEMRANDNKDRWIALLNITDGSLEQLERQHDSAWIGGPGIGYFSNYEISMGWMPDDKSIWFQSEKSGYSHLYTVNTETKKKKALTKGKYEIFNPKISNDKQHWYFSSNMEHPGEVHFYHMPLKGGKVRKLTDMVGNNEVYLSPDETKMAILYSFSNKPWEIYIQDNPIYSGKKEKPGQVTKSTTKKFNAYGWRVPENITFKANDGEKVYARLYKPKTENNNKAAIIFVHGAGYLQNAHKWWSSYYREYMFHNVLVDNGFTVLDIDYRGSAGYGHDWRTKIYRHMGGKDLLDQVDGAKYLVKEHNIDPQKVGIYGGSYGGFITLMAMFKAAGTFKSGAAIRSVTDWAHYNHGYTSNILNTPVTDSLAYRRSSPIYYAEGLKGNLLMLHGMIDDNVHFQDVVRLSQRLIELGKENWDVAIYPVERHAFVEPSSWTDEYKRILKLFKETLLDN